MPRMIIRESADSKKPIKYLISDSEGIIMDYLWKEKEGKLFREIMEYLNVECQKPWKKQTVNTFINRLTNKGLVVSENCGGNKKYSPALNYTEYKQGEAKNFLDVFYSGSVYTFLSTLSGGQKIDSSIADELRKFLEEK